MPPEEIIIQAWRRELGSYVAEPMLHRIARATVRALHDAGWELTACDEAASSPPVSGANRETFAS